MLLELRLLGTPLPLRVVKSFWVQNFSEIPLSFCPQPLSFCSTEQDTASERAVLHPYSWADPARSPLRCPVAVRAVCCTVSFGNPFSFPCCRVSKLCVLLSTDWAEICYLCVTLLSYSSPQRERRSTGLPWAPSSCLNTGGRWKPV